MNKITTIISPLFYLEEKKCIGKKLTSIFLLTIYYLPFREKNRVMN